MANAIVGTGQCLASAESETEDAQARSSSSQALREDPVISGGTIASLALPKFFTTIEYSRSTQALSTLALIQSSLMDCFQTNETYVGCDGLDTPSVGGSNATLGAHFDYEISNLSDKTYTITATRVTDGDGPGGDTIIIAFDSAATPAITKVGTGAFSGI